MKKINTLNNVDIYKTEVLVVGSGAAGLSAINYLYSKNIKEATLITEGIKCGTSINTGSDKQTYYKLSLSGEDKDSVRELAEDLYKGGCVDGDIALVEASLSAESFYRLSTLGVPFPKNKYGEYVGYKTDHDPHKRATSAGPYTSKYMCQSLLKEAVKNNVEIVENLQLVKLIKENEQIKGALFLSRKDHNLTYVKANYIICATGGPAGIYKNSVYPESQFGSNGIIFDTGARFQNVTEWQYGLASVKPRWNVSGSYMQVLPRFISVDENGKETEYLFNYNEAEYKMLTNIFLKGYQWPFDVRKVENGSSIVDVLTYLELEKGRRVYLDFTKNRFNKEIDFEKLESDAYIYLKNSNALLDTPIKRLLALNKPAYDFYKDKNIDLEKEYLEISLSSQHNNGGVEVNMWWETNINNLFVIGEAAATHGVYRPGGSALNSGQVGSLRSVEMIKSRLSTNKVVNDELLEIEKEVIKEESNNLNKYFINKTNINDLYNKLKETMSIKASVIREETALKEALSEIEELETKEISVEKETSLFLVYEFKNALSTAKAYITGMLKYIELSSSSRGSALYTKKDGEIRPKDLDSRFIYDLENERCDDIILVYKEKDEIKTKVRKCRPLPTDEDFFEVVWAQYRKNKNIML